MKFTRASISQRLAIIITLIGILVIPFIGAYLCNKSSFPDGYFEFPPTTKKPKPGPDTIALGISAIIFILIIILYFFPQLFGFKKNAGEHDFSFSKEKLPFWFWIGLVAWGTAIILFATNASEPRWLTNWSFLPLCWGFILIMDGFVYSVNKRKSLISTDFKTLLKMAGASISGWLIYEYLNFFINFNWYYPEADRLMSLWHFRIYSFLGSSAFIPMSFECYDLLKRIKVLNYKYAQGPKICFSSSVSIALLISFSILLFITPFFPDNLFSMVWIAPVFIVAIVIKLLNIDSPFKLIRDGNWTLLLGFALTFLIQGFLLEWWNVLSEECASGPNGGHCSNNPTNWVYMIPYVQKWPIFEMPFFGYLGYLFFFDSLLALVGTFKTSFLHRFKI